MPDIIIVAGPNGAGKTSFANEYFRLQFGPFTFINADEIEKLLPSTISGAARPTSAGRAMLLEIDRVVTVGGNLAIETTLATRQYVRRISDWRSRGYSIGLVYLRLPTVEHSIDRVRRRVASGGHAIPEETIRRRFDKSWQYFNALYRPLVDEWYVWESREGEFVPLEAWDEQ